MHAISQIVIPVLNIKILSETSKFHKKNKQNAEIIDREREKKRDR